MESFLQDIRYALRTMRRSAGFTFVAVACLTLGIAVNTTIFSTFNALILRPFDFEDPERLAYLADRPTHGQGNMSISWLTYRDWREQTTSFAGMAVASGRSLTITEGEEPERLEGQAVSWNLFSLLGKAPQLGRDFREDEDSPASARVVILGDEVWRRRYTADPSVVGRIISINSFPHTVIGVMPKGFKFPEDAELWVTAGPLVARDSRLDRTFDGYGRLKPGVSMERADRDLSAVSKRLFQQYEPDLVDKWVGRAIELHKQAIPNDIRLLMGAMMGAVTFVLLIACANVANLMLSRATARQREMAIRTAIGAGRMRIARQLLTESVLIALAAGILAIPLSNFGLKLIRMSIPASDPLPYYINFVIDRTALVYTFAISILTGILFGLAPALQAARGKLHDSLKDGGRGSGAGVSRNRLRNVLVVSEVGLSLVLLVGASLFVRSFMSLESFPVGFRTAPIMTMRYYLPGTRYDSVDVRQRKVEDIIRRVEALPGVEAAASSVLIPLSGGGGGDRVVVEGRDVPKGDEPRFQWNAVAGHWFETLGVPIASGRTMTEAELRDTLPVAVINRTMAKQLWPNADALGRRFRRASDTTRTWFTVVGVAADFRNYGPSEQKEQPPAAYVPYRFFSPRNHGLIVRVRGEPSSIMSSVRSQIRAADASVPVFEVQTMEEARRESFWQFGLFGSMFSTFGGIALLLAAIGIYGVISFGVAQRTQEIGVRVALGAQHRHVLGMVVGHGVRLTAIGVGIGLVGAFGITRVLSSLLWGVSASDPLSFAGVAIFLTLVAALASYLPARRATAVDPIIALRSE